MVGHVGVGIGHHVDYGLHIVELFLGVIVASNMSQCTRRILFTFPCYQWTFLTIFDYISVCRRLSIGTE